MQIFSLLIFAFLFLVSLNKTSRQNSLFAVLQYSEIFGLQMVRKDGISFSSTAKFRLKLMFCVIFVNVLVWRWFGVPLFPICTPLFHIRVPLVPICVTLSTHPISRYFCKDSLIPLMTPPQHTTPRQASLLLLLPLQKFSSYHFLHFPFVFIRVHSCSLVFHSCSLLFHSCSTRVHSCPLVFIRVPLVFTRVHSCSFVFVRVHSCSFVFRSVWCFRYDLFKSSILFTRLCLMLNQKSITCLIRSQVAVKRVIGREKTCRFHSLV